MRSVTIPLESVGRQVRLVATARRGLQTSQSAVATPLHRGKRSARGDLSSAPGRIVGAAPGVCAAVRVGAWHSEAALASGMLRDSPSDRVPTAVPSRTQSVLSLIHISEPTRRTPISYAVF